MDCAAPAEVAKEEGLDRSEMLADIRALDVDEMAIFLAPDEQEGQRTMFAIRNLHRREDSKRFRSFFCFPKIYVIRYA